MKPGEVRSELEKIQIQMRSLERELHALQRAGQFEYRDVSFELGESSEGVTRALEILDTNLQRRH